MRKSRLAIWRIVALSPTHHHRFMRRRIAAWSSWTSGLDGGLLTDAAWHGRHLIVAGIASVNGGLAIAFSAAKPHDAWMWLQAVALVVALAVAWAPLRARRPRELAIVVAFLLCAALQNHYVANLSTLSGAYVLLIAVYQDWLPLAASLVGILALPALAIVAPDSLASWKSFQAESPGTGALVRTLGVYVAAGVAVLVWRANGVAARDGMTGLATREHAERRLSRALRDGRRPAVLIGDVDVFRLVADELPRAGSDALIRDVGQRLRAAVGNGNGAVIVAAGGGARYILVRLDDTSADEGTALARRWCEAVGHATFAVADAEVPLTISVGVALGSPEDAASDLLRAAELAMRQAKWGGDPAVAIADEELLGRRLRPDRPITAQLRRALERDELVIHYQPFVAIATGEIVGAEALVRWQHPTRGLLAPSAFLPAAELHPWLNVQMSRYISGAVLAELADWDRDMPGRLPLGVSINLAPTRLKDPSLRAAVAAALDEARVDPGRLIIELTEGAIMDFESDAPKALADLAGLGVRIALDDFGAGHSSLAHLRDFPLHVVKVDKSFVAGVVTRPSDQAVIAAVLAIAEQFGATVVVEGVETEEQRQALAAMAPDVIAQGYHFARPMPPAEFETLLAEGLGLPRPAASASASRTDRGRGPGR
jgi:diguanylate cyclase (GGDEF)-like protein